MADAVRFVQLEYSPAEPGSAARRVVKEVSESTKEGTLVALVPASAEKEWKPRHDAFLGSSATEPILTINSPHLRLHRRPGRAVLFGKPDRYPDVLAALTDFEHFEAEMRRIELELDRTEADAERDLPKLFDVRTVEHREYFAERMQHFSRLRLEFARLEPHWARPARVLPPRSRLWMEKLIERAELEDRAEAVSDRLELREELYEGAADRAADTAGWANGHRLEVIIILLLIVEIGFMATELWLHWRELHADPI